MFLLPASLRSREPRSIQHTCGRKADEPPGQAANRIWGPPGGGSLLLDEKRGVYARRRAGALHVWSRERGRARGVAVVHTATDRHVLATSSLNSTAWGEADAWLLPRATRGNRLPDGQSLARPGFKPGRHRLWKPHVHQMAESPPRAGLRFWAETASPVSQKELAAGCASSPHATSSRPDVLQCRACPPLGAASSLLARPVALTARPCALTRMMVYLLLVYRSLLLFPLLGCCSESRRDRSRASL